VSRNVGGSRTAVKGGLRTFSVPEGRAWGGFLATHQRLVHRLDTEMRERHGLSLSGYEVLLYLGRSEEGRLRMGDLAAAVLLTPSGLTRVVDRLVAEELVERAVPPGNRREIHAVLTAQGRERLLAAHDTHHEGVRRWFLSRCSAEDLERLAAVWAAIDLGLAEQEPGA
jgi:DNA-binding MarR family transcriptional regulator